MKYWLFISFVIPVNLNEKHVRPIRGSALVHIILFTYYMFVTIGFITNLLINFGNCVCFLINFKFTYKYLYRLIKYFDSGLCFICLKCNKRNVRLYCLRSFLSNFLCINFQNVGEHPWCLIISLSRRELCFVYSLIQPMTSLNCLSDCLVVCSFVSCYLEFVSPLKKLTQLLKKSETPSQHSSNVKIPAPALVLVILHGSVPHLLYRNRYDFFWFSW